MSPEHRRLLQMLTDVAEGVNEAMLHRHGFTPALLAEAVAGGTVFVTMRDHANPPGLKVRRLHLSEDGRRAPLATRPAPAARCAS